MKHRFMLISFDKDNPVELRERIEDKQLKKHWYGKMMKKGLRYIDLFDVFASFVKNRCR